jgi:hypothetical protein
MKLLGLAKADQPPLALLPHCETKKETYLILCGINYNQHSLCQNQIRSEIHIIEIALCKYIPHSMVKFMYLVTSLCYRLLLALHFGSPAFKEQIV